MSLLAMMVRRITRPLFALVQPLVHFLCINGMLNSRGDSKSLKIHNFLKRVEELREARDLTVDQLFEQSLDLFDVKALIWFRVGLELTAIVFRIGNLFQRYWSNIVSHLIKNHG